MDLVEERLRNKSSLPTELARAVTLARYTSVVYCNPENIRAWNCSRRVQPAADTPAALLLEIAAWTLFHNTL